MTFPRELLQIFDIGCCDYEASDKAADLSLPCTLCDECLGEAFMVIPEMEALLFKL